MSSAHFLLPPELWLKVISHLTSELTSLYACSYEPFTPSESGLDERRTAARVVLTQVALVCRKFNAFVAPFLHENARVDDWAFIENEEGEAQSYRRCVLPYHQTATPSYNFPPLQAAMAVLSSRCWNLEVLIRPGPLKTVDMAWLQLKYEFPAPSPPSEVLSSVKRLEWWHRDDASRTGGINSLTDVLDLTPRLEYLALGGVLQPYSFSQRDRRLEHLKILRLYQANVYFLWLIRTWDLPSLQHLILDWSPEPVIATDVTSFFSKSLRTIELGRNLCFYLKNHLIPLLRVCPNLTEISYYLYFTQPSETLFPPHTSLTTVRLHSHPNMAIHGELQQWETIGSHFSLLTSKSLPVLQRIVLHGDWTSELADKRMLLWRRSLQKLGRRLERPDGTVIE